MRIAKACIGQLHVQYYYSFKTYARKDNQASGVAGPVRSPCGLRVDAGHRQRPQRLCRAAQLLRPVLRLLRRRSPASLTLADLLADLISEAADGFDLCVETELLQPAP
jgi:hypothetical protein